MPQSDLASHLPTQRFSFSTAVLPAAEREAIWREEFGREFVRLEMEPLDGADLHYNAEFQALGDTTIALGKISATVFSRTQSLLEDGNDNIVLLMPLDAPLRADTRRAEAELAPGDCLVRRSDEIGSTRLKSGRFLTLALPAAQLSEQVADLDALHLARVPATMEAMPLLKSYCQTLMEQRTPPSPDMAHVTRQHLIDMAALAIGANRDAWHVAQDRGVRAARRATALAAIRRNASNPDYRIAHLAAKMHVSESYIRKILADDGVTFSALLRQARLESARARLEDPRYRERQIGLIALECGFNDISYFNRVFQRHYGQTPTQCRQARKH